MGRISFRAVEAHDVTPYAAQLLALERGITYPLGDEDGAERFYIDHGAAYHPFFSTMGTARFGIVVEEQQNPAKNRREITETVLGSVAGVWRHAIGPVQQKIPTLYIADLKLSPTARGKGISRRLLRWGLWQIVSRSDLRGWRMCFGVAMRGSSGDVSNTFTGAHPAQMAGRLAVLQIYFVSREALLSLPEKAQAASSPCPILPTDIMEHGLDLSPNPTGESDQPILTRTQGRKDLRLVSTGAEWPLWHLPQSPRTWGKRAGGVASYLYEAATQMPAQALACFALDTTLQPQIQWLSKMGIVSNTFATVYALRLPPPFLRWQKPTWIHVATSEI